MGKTHGVNKASNPPKKPNKKIFKGALVPSLTVALSKY